MANKKSEKGEAHSLRELLIMKLKSLLDVETQLVKALPKMAKHAADDDLRAGFENHFGQTKNHVTRVERALELLHAKPQKIPTDAIKGLVSDAEWVIKNVEGEAALDAALIAAAQYVEHYEMAGYGTAIAWATLLQNQEVVDLLQQTFDEEDSADAELSQLAESKINGRALGIA